MCESLAILLFMHQLCHIVIYIFVIYFCTLLWSSWVKQYVSQLKIAQFFLSFHLVFLQAKG